MQLEAEVMKSAEQLQGVDFTGESIISSMDRNSETMHINFDYYSRNRCYKSYQCKEKIPDSFSRIIWNLYEKYPEVNSIAIVRPFYTMLWASIGQSIPPMNAYHAEHFSGEIVCTEGDPEPFADYAKHETKRVVQAIGNKKVLDNPAVLLRDFGAVVFGRDCAEVVKNVTILEKIAQAAWHISMSMTSLTYMNYSKLMAFHCLYNGEENPLNSDYHAFVQEKHEQN